MIKSNIFQKLLLGKLDKDMKIFSHIKFDDLPSENEWLDLQFH